jgi:VWFA-related protein
MRLTRRRLLAACALSALDGELCAGSDQTPVFSAGVKVVNLYATVRDRQGMIVNDLIRTDFNLEEDGRRQAIRYFSRESDLPLAVGLLIDTSGSTLGVQQAERDAGSRFLHRVMRLDQDRAFIVQFDSRIYLLQDVTDELDDLDRAAYSAGRPVRDGTARQLQPPGTTLQHHGTTLLYDAALCVANDIVRPQSGRKAVVILSDGMDAGSLTTLAGAIEAAQRADMLVYAILFQSRIGSAITQTYPTSRNPMGLPRIGTGPLHLPLPTPRASNRHVTRRGALALQEISNATGGRYFEVSERLGLDGIFALIEDDLRHQYSLGYTPDHPAVGSAYRRIRLSTRRRGVTVRARAGYYPS